jgi:hypothetical protein
MNIVDTLILMMNDKMRVWNDYNRKLNKTNEDLEFMKRLKSQIEDLERAIMLNTPFKPQ